MFILLSTPLLYQAIRPAPEANTFFRKSKPGKWLQCHLYLWNTHEPSPQYERGEGIGSTFYQGHYRTRPACGLCNHAAIPQRLKADSIGPRLAATLGDLAGGHHVSARGLKELVEEAFGVAVALGTVANLRTQLADALALAHAEALAAVRAAPV
jgi:hypothetical protein